MDRLQKSCSTCELLWLPEIGMITNFEHCSIDVDFNLIWDFGLTLHFGENNIWTQPEEHHNNATCVILLLSFITTAIKDWILRRIRMLKPNITGSQYSSSEDLLDTQQCTKKLIGCTTITTRRLICSINQHSQRLFIGSVVLLKFLAKLPSAIWLHDGRWFSVIRAGAISRGLWSAPWAPSNHSSNHHGNADNAFLWLGALACQLAWILVRAHRQVSRGAGS